MKNQILYFLAFIFLSINYVTAQVPGLPMDDNGDPNVQDVPIHLFIYPLLILGTYLGYRVIKKQ